MLKEDYCSYEVAKLLKEKGFNEPIRCWYDNFQDFHEEGVRMSNTDCLPPTIMDHWEGYIDSFEISIYSHASTIIVPNEIIHHTDYIEAIEAALKFCLENLI